MKSLKELLNENISHLRNLYILIDEKLRDIEEISHSNSRRRNQSIINGTEGINKNEILDAINKCDKYIVDKLLNNKIKINISNERFGIRKLLKLPYSCVAFIFEVTYFNKETFEYDLKLITSNKYKEKIFIFKDIKFGFEIDKSNYVREISK